MADLGYASGGTRIFSNTAATTGVLLAAGAKVWHIGVLAPAGLGVVAAGLFTSEYRMKRITSFLDPYADPAGDGSM